MNNLLGYQSFVVDSSMNLDLIRHVMYALKIRTSCTDVSTCLFREYMNDQELFITDTTHGYNRHVISWTALFSLKPFHGEELSNEEFMLLSKMIFGKDYESQILGYTLIFRKGINVLSSIQRLLKPCEEN